MTKIYEDEKIKIYKTDEGKIVLDNKQNNKAVYAEPDGIKGFKLKEV